MLSWIFMFFGVIFVAMGVLASPIAIGMALYDWAIVDAELKYALWHGFKVWIGMLFCLAPGFALMSIAK